MMNALNSLSMTTCVSNQEQKGSHGTEHSSFLFIYKDASSGSLSNSKYDKMSAKSISSHVTRWQKKNGPRKRGKSWKLKAGLRPSKDTKFGWRLKTPTPPDLDMPDTSTAQNSDIASSQQDSPSKLDGDTFSLAEDKSLLLLDAKASPEEDALIPPPTATLVADSLALKATPSTETWSWSESPDSACIDGIWNDAGVGPMDPFDSLPIQLKKHEYEDLQFYCSLPSMMYGFENHKVSKMYHQVIVRTAINTPSVLYAILMGANQQRELITHTKSPYKLSYETAVVSAIKKKIQIPSTRFSPEVLCLVGTALYGEHDFWPSRPILASHLQAFWDILRHLIGWEPLEHQVETFSIAIVISIAAMHSLVEYLDSAPLESRASIINHIHDFHRDRDELVHSLIEWNDWAGERQNDPTSYRRNSHEARHNSEEESFPLNFLQSPFLMTFLMKPSDPCAMDSERSHRFFAIFYLVLVLWDSRHSPQDYTHFLERLRETLEPYHTSREYATSCLFWVLLKVETYAKPERKWRALRFLKIVHKLEPELTARIERFLLGMLAPAGSVETMVLIEEEDIAAIRRQATFTLPTLPVSDC